MQIYDCGSSQKKKKKGETFGGFPAVPNKSLFSGNDFAPVIMGLAQKQRLSEIV